MENSQTSDPFTALSLEQAAFALSALRASSSPPGLARAVARLLTGSGALGCRIDLFAPVTAIAPEGLITLARSVDPTRRDLGDPARDLGDEPAASSTTAVIADCDRDLSWVVVPLVAQRRPVGALRVVLEGAAHPPAELLAYLHHIGSSLGLGLSAAELHEQAERVSRSLQDSLLPSAVPRADWFLLAARYEPATAGMHVGGDWYDAQLLNSRELALSVGDVAGHGVEAAARMGELRSAITALRLLSRSPSDLVATLHRLCEQTEHFATAICARMNPTGRLRWSSAGHFAPIVARASGTAEILSGGQSPPLGVGVPGSVALNDHRLGDGDTVLLFTDGLVERRDELLDTSLARLIEHVEAGLGAGLEPAGLVDHVLAARHEAGSTSDDIAVVAVRVLLSS